MIEYIMRSLGGDYVDNIERLLNQLLLGQKNIEGTIIKVIAKQDKMQEKIEGMKEEIANLNKKTDMIYEKVAENVEGIERINRSLDFTKARQMDIEEEIYHIKRKIS